MAFTRVHSTMNVAHEYSNGNLNITIELTFKPFDVRDYENEFASPDSADSDNLKWLYCTIYNYIPIAIIHNTQPGIYDNIEEGNWEEDYQDDLWQNVQFDIDGTEWELGSLVTVEGDENLYIDNLRQLANDYITPNDEWYETIMGKTFAFTHALNANMEFSHLQPNTYLGFTNCVLDVLGDATKYDKYGVWKHNGLDSDTNPCKVTITATIENVPDDEDRTYAVVSADPSNGTLFTKCIHIKKESSDDIDSLQYIDDSLTINGADNKIIASITQVGDKRVRIKLTRKLTTWKTLAPQIRFRVKHVTS